MWGTPRTRSSPRRTTDSGPGTASRGGLHPLPASASHVHADPRIAMTTGSTDPRAGHLRAPDQLVDREADGIDVPLFLGRDTHALSGPAFRTIVEVGFVGPLEEAAGSIDPIDAGAFAAAFAAGVNAIVAEPDLASGTGAAGRQRAVE